MKLGKLQRENKITSKRNGWFQTFSLFHMSSETNVLNDLVAVWTIVG